MSLHFSKAQVRILHRLWEVRQGLQPKHTVISGGEWVVTRCDRVPDPYIDLRQRGFVVIHLDLRGGVGEMRVKLSILGAEVCRMLFVDTPLDIFQKK